MKYISQILYLLLTTCIVFGLLYTQKINSMDIINKLQFIGWLKQKDALNVSYYLWFHKYNKTFLISPTQLPNSFYVLCDKDTIHHNDTVNIDNVQFQIILDK